MYRLVKHFPLLLGFTLSTITPPSVMSVAREPESNKDWEVITTLKRVGKGVRTLHTGRSDSPILSPNLKYLFFFKYFVHWVKEVGNDTSLSQFVVLGRFKTNSECSHNDFRPSAC